MPVISRCRPCKTISGIYPPCDKDFQVLNNWKSLLFHPFFNSFFRIFFLCLETFFIVLDLEKELFPVQSLSYLVGNVFYCERLLKKVNAFFKDTMTGYRVGRVAGHEQNHGFRMKSFQLFG
ncbi:MAG: hypothetical protein A4E66_01483 [Syntrophus sp. PtaB.Bin001]|nr:MAG: hypothetical protein A4E66_01483 [Syntrophus sp. PtaB.Bin001]